MGPYQAPLRCTGPIEGMIPEAHFVYIHRGCSLEQHKRTAGEGLDFDQAIEHVFPEDER